MKLNKRKKGFTIVELIVVMAIIGVLVLLAMPKFMDYTKQAKLTQIKVDTKQLENASERYYIDKQDWPRLSDTPYTSAQITSFTQEVTDKTGQVVTLDSSGSYYDVNYTKLQQYVQKPKNDIHYIIQNPVGEIYHLGNLTPTGEERLNPPVILNNKPVAVITMTPGTALTTATNITWAYSNSTDIDGDSITNGEWQGNQATYTAGTYTVQLRVQDIKGLWSDWTSKTISVLPNPLGAEILNESFSNNTLDSNVWSSFIQDTGSSISFSNGQLLINNSAGYTHTGAGIYTKTPMNLTGIITVEYDWTMGNYYGSALGSSVGFFNFDNAPFENVYYGGHSINTVKTRNHSNSIMYLETVQGNSAIITVNPAYIVGNTYHIKVVFNTNTRYFEYFINNSSVFSRILTTTEMGPLGTRIGVQIMKGNYETNSVDKYDNIKIYQQ